MRITARFLAALVLLGSAGPAVAGFASAETFLPAVGRVAGQGGAQFYTTVWATNLTGASVAFTFEFLKQGQANPSPASFTDSLAPGETKVYENVVESQLGLSGELGAARITASGEILVSERIYNQAPGDDLGKTEGLFFAGVPKSFSISPGQSASIQGINQGSSENFRYNFALVETGGGSPTVNVQLFDGNATMLGQKAYDLHPFEQIQPNVADLYSGIATTNARITATVTGGSGSVLIAGAQLANESQDSSGFEMSFRDGVLAGGAGVTSVNSLTGALTLAAGSGVSITPSGSTLTIAATGGSGGGVSSLNTLTGALSITAGSGISVTPSGASIQVAYTGGGSGGLASVATDPSLHGNGTGPLPLGINVPLTLASGSGDAISGAFTGSGGSNAGVFGSSASNSGFGMHGLNTDSGNNGYLGGPDYSVFGNSVNGAHGVVGATTGSGHAGVYGSNSSGSGYGVNGFNSGSGNNGYLGGPDYGVFGVSNAHPGVIGTSASGFSPGVKGTSSVGNGWGVEGINVASTNYGLLGGTAFGVQGVNNSASGYGIEGIDNSGSTSGTGVYGSSGSGYAGYFSGAVEMTSTLLVVGDVLVEGSFNAGSPKNFVAPDSSNPSRQIVYTCLEGPESGTYFRGSGKITGGFATIEVPESFRLVSSANGITVVATAVGSPASLTVMKKGLDRIVVQGSSDVDFDFMVNGVRAGFEDHQTIQPNKYYIPRSATDDMARHMAAGTVTLLKANGTLNADGSINLETARRLGWDQQNGWNAAEAANRQ